MSSPTSRDLLRRITVTVSLLACCLGTLFGIGVIGTRVAESSGGDLAADATLLAPAGTAFSIWSLVYTGLAAYTIRQWMPGIAMTPRERSIGWLAAATMVLNAAWLLLTQIGLIWLSVVVIVVLVVSLGTLVLRLHQHPESSWWGRLIVDGTFGLYLGWVTAATCANVAAAAGSSGWDLGDGANQVIASIIVLVAAGIGLTYARYFGARIAVVLALVWALAWIAYGRLADQPASTAVGITAIIAAVALILGTLLIARRQRRAADELSDRRLSSARGI